jgi:hypothetical protein
MIHIEQLATRFNAGTGLRDPRPDLISSAGFCRHFFRRHFLEGDNFAGIPDHGHPMATRFNAGTGLRDPRPDLVSSAGFCRQKESPD